MMASTALAPTTRTMLADRKNDDDNTDNAAADDAALMPDSSSSSSSSSSSLRADRTTHVAATINNKRKPGTDTTQPKKKKKKKTRKREPALAKKKHASFDQAFGEHLMKKVLECTYSATGQLAKVFHEWRRRQPPGERTANGKDWEATFKGFFPCRFCVTKGCFSKRINSGKDKHKNMCCKHSPAVKSQSSLTTTQKREKYKDNNKKEYDAMEWFCKTVISFKQLSKDYKDLLAFVRCWEKARADILGCYCDTVQSVSDLMPDWHGKRGKRDIETIVRSNGKCLFGIQIKSCDTIDEVHNCITFARVRDYGPFMVMLMICKRRGIVAIATGDHFCTSSKSLDAYRTEKLNMDIEKKPQTSKDMTLCLNTLAEQMKKPARERKGAYSHVVAFSGSESLTSAEGKRGQDALRTAINTVMQRYKTCQEIQAKQASSSSTSSTSSSTSSSSSSTASTVSLPTFESLYLPQDPKSRIEYYGITKVFRLLTNSTALFIDDFAYKHPEIEHSTVDLIFRNYKLFGKNVQVKVISQKKGKGSFQIKYHSSDGKPYTETDFDALMVILVKMGNNPTGKDMRILHVAWFPQRFAKSIGLLPYTDADGTVVPAQRKSFTIFAPRDRTSDRDKKLRKAMHGDANFTIRRSGSFNKNQYGPKQNKDYGDTGDKEHPFWTSDDVVHRYLPL